MKQGLCWALTVSCLLLPGCGSLPYSREMGDMALLRTMGVDLLEEEVRVTVSTGPRVRGLQGEQQPSLVLSAQGASLSGAALELQGMSESYVFFGYVDQLLLGEELARQGVEPVLDYFARDVELGLGAQLWLVQGASAEEAVRSGGEQGVEGRLSTLRTDGEMGIAAITRTAGEVLSDLLEWGSAYVPALVCAEEEEAASLRESGYAVLKEGKLAGFLEGEAAAGLELLTGRTSSDVLEVLASGELVAVRVTGVDTSCRMEEGKLRIICQIQARAAEYQTPLEEAELNELSLQLEQRERDRIQAALSQMQAWGADCTGVGPRAALASPGQWQAGEETWAEQFASQPLELEVRVTIQG